MNDKTNEAYQWAISQDFQSVAARHARTLAEYVCDLGDLEVDYPNWRGKFASIADAVRFHTRAQDAVIRDMRAGNEKLRKQQEDQQYEKMGKWATEQPDGGAQ